MPNANTAHEFLKRNSLLTCGPNEQPARGKFQTHPDEICPSGVEAYWDRSRTVAFLLPKDATPRMVYDVMADLDAITYSGTDGSSYYELDDAIMITVILEW